MNQRTEFCSSFPNTPKNNSTPGFTFLSLDCNQNRKVLGEGRLIGKRSEIGQTSVTLMLMRSNKHNVK